MEVLKYICYSGHLLSFILLVKLLFLGKKLNFLNSCFITIFFYEGICGMFMIPNFFSLGLQNWLGEDDPDLVRAECARWFTSYCVLGIFLAFINTGMIFTRYIYVAYAGDLVSAGEKLLNILVVVAVSIFSLQWIIVYPVVGEAIEEDYPLNYIKGKICTQTFIDEFYENRENILFSIKPKVTLISLDILLASATLACTRAALKIPKRFPIQTYRRHLLDIKSHTTITCLLFLFCALDQILNMIIQIFYQQLGVELVFKIWWTFHLIFLLNIYVVTNVWIFCDTRENFKELHQLPSWLKGRTGVVEARETELFEKREIPTTRQG